ncbi:hypothetical protein JXA59_02905 [Patescibacteria group bacterium]|nr:hypothetical protein [Patescibacteria group bacterium]
MAKKNSNTGGCGWFMDDWFYALIAILIGFALLGVNLGWLEPSWIDYWPVLLIVIGGKELLERN